MRLSIVTLACFLTAGIIFSSCKKDSGSNSAIVGTWTQSYNIDDLNGNGLPDDTHNVITGTPGTITFNSNGSGTATESFGGTPISVPFTWTLSGSNLRTITATDTANVTVIELSSSKLTVRDDSGSQIEWDYFIR